MTNDSAATTAGADAIAGEFATYRRLFDQKYRELDEILLDLPDAALLWKPFATSPWQGPCNSIGEIVAHSVSSTVYLLRRTEWTLGRRAWGEVDGDEGSEEFGPANHQVAYLQARVQRTRAMVHAILDSLNLADLDGQRPHPDRPRPITVRYDIQHAIEHLSQHIGHAQLTRQLWAINQE